MAVLDDAYNANPLSMTAALRTLATLPGRTYAVLGDMLELGEAERHAHAAVLHAAMTCGLAAVWVTGPRMAEAALHVPGVVVFSDAEALAEQLVATIAAGDSLLVKGSRGARMERVVERLRAARRG